MAIVIHRSWTVAPADLTEFERLSREEVFPYTHARGGKILGLLTNGAGGRANEVTILSAWASYGDWEVARRPSGMPADAEAELRRLGERAIAAEHRRLELAVIMTERVLESATNWVDYGLGTPAPAATVRPLGELKPEIVVQRSWILPPASVPEFERLSREEIWPYMEARGCKVVGLFTNASPGRRDQVFVLMAYASQAHWSRVRDLPLPADSPACLRHLQERAAEAVRLRDALAPVMAERVLLPATNWVDYGASDR